MHIFDERRNLIVISERQAAEEFAAKHWISCAKEAIQRRGNFFVALSGGSTPNAIYQKLASEYLNELDWSKVHLFWSDERSVPPTDADSNYKMAMDAGLKQLPIPANQIHRMHAEEGDKAAKNYEELIRNVVHDQHFDLVMLGMGEDGHTASLFPHTKALEDFSTLVTMNHVPQKSTWRMTMTYPLINQSRHIAIYVLGAGKADMVHQVLEGASRPHDLPIQKIGTPTHKALWILDKPAAAKLQLPESACLS